MSDTLKVNLQKSVEPLQKTEQEETKNNKVQKQYEPSIGRLLLNRSAAVVMTLPAAAAGVITIVAGGVAGAIKPNETFEQGVSKGIDAASQGAEMLESMWNGKYF